MASAFDRIMDTARPHLPGSIDDAIRQELFGVCQEFFGESNTWREHIDTVLKYDENMAEIMPYSGQIKRLLHVLDKDKTPVQRVILTDPIQGVLRFPFKANGDTDYTAVVAIIPSDPVDRDAFPIVPYDLITMYWREIMHGLLAAMMAQPSKPYTNPTGVALYTSKFKGGIARARNRANAGETKNSQNWRYPQSFNRR